jgi:hypothetical protein
MKCEYRSRKHISLKKVLYFEFKNAAVRVGWKNFHNEEICDFVLLTKSNRVINSRSMRWVVYVARMVERQNSRRILMGTPEENRSLVVPKFRRKTLKGFKGSGWDNSALLGFYAASPEDGTDILSRNVGK